MLENVVFTDSALEATQKIIDQSAYDKIGILVDENTAQHCLPLLNGNFDFAQINIQSGEEYKNLQTCGRIWSELTSLGFSRKSLLINLGGGVITDMGGFAASTFKRGIDFINIPTTLLAQVDASIGGKTGVDFDGFKNHIGIFSEPQQVILDTRFLDTLDARQLRSGFAEVLKHGLIADAAYWREITSKPFVTIDDWNNYLEQSVKIKAQVVENDPKEMGLRKILNFGHTLGHAIETYFLTSDCPLLHGEAIAAGMILEAHLSYQAQDLTEGDLSEITGYIKEVYEEIKLPETDILMDLMSQDKKNTGKQINFSLLQKIGHCTYDVHVEHSQIGAAMEAYVSLYK